MDGKTLITASEDIDNISYAFSKAVLSSVKIVANHTVNTYNNLKQITGTKIESFTGAGVIYQLDGNGNAYIITNYHVVFYTESLSANKVSEDISVFLYGMDYTQYAIAAQYVGGSLTYDIAVIKVTASEILKNSISQPVSLSSEEVLPGLKTIAIGNPLSDGLSVSSGIVNVASEKHTSTGADDVTEIEFRSIKIDTPVNGGNSGGGLFNLKGELVGIVNAKQISIEIDNVGYAIPLEIAIGVAQNLIDNCDETNQKVKKCLLGVQVNILSSTAVVDETTTLVHIREEIAVHSVVGESSLVYGVLEEGDIIVSVKLNDTTFTIDRMHILTDLLLNARIDDTLEFIIIRENVTLSKSVIVTAQAITIIE